MAIGAFQKAGVCMAQKFRCHLLAGIVLQQEGCEEVPEGMQVILRRKIIFPVESAKPPGKRIRMHRSLGSGEDIVIRVDDTSCSRLLQKQLPAPAGVNILKATSHTS